MAPGEQRPEEDPIQAERKTTGLRIAFASNVALSYRTPGGARLPRQPKRRLPPRLPLPSAQTPRKSPNS